MVDKKLPNSWANLRPDGATFGKCVAPSLAHPSFPRQVVNEAGEAFALSSTVRIPGSLQTSRPVVILDRRAARRLAFILACIPWPASLGSIRASTTRHSEDHHRHHLEAVSAMRRRYAVRARLRRGSARKWLSRCLTGSAAAASKLQTAFNVSCQSDDTRLGTARATGCCPHDTPARNSNSRMAQLNELIHSKPSTVP